MRYQQHGREHVVRVSGEVILSGGAINSPQLLQLSGIGPASLLHSLGIKIVHDNGGVGADLQDHYQARAIVELNKAISVNDEANRLHRLILAGLQYALFRRGPATFSAGHVNVFKSHQSLRRLTPNSFYPIQRDIHGGALLHFRCDYLGMSVT